MAKKKYPSPEAVEGEQLIQTYVAIYPVKFGGKLYKLRDILHLTDAEAATWLRRGYIAPVDLTETED
jgi:hypothetical protein